MKLDEVNAEILKGLSDKERESFLEGLKALNMENPTDREALRESIRKAQPDYTPEQIEIFLDGRNPPAKGLGTLKESFIRLGFGEKQAEIAASGNVRGMGNTEPGGSDREALIASVKRAHPDWSEVEIEAFITGR